MNACIYARTCRAERGDQTTTIANQVAYCRDLAERYNLRVEEEHIYTDVDKAGSLAPTCWAEAPEDSRPALSEMVAAIEDGQVSRVIVRRIEKLGTTSDILLTLTEFLVHHGVYVVAAPEQVTEPTDPRSRFAISLLRPCIQVGPDEAAEARQRLKLKKLEEIQRLQSRIARLEAEVAGL